MDPSRYNRVCNIRFLVDSPSKSYFKFMTTHDNDNPYVKDREIVMFFEYAPPDHVGSRNIGYLNLTKF